MTYRKVSLMSNKTRKDLMATMAEMSFHLPNVTPERQEEVAFFMVQQFKGDNVQIQPFPSHDEDHARS